MNLPHYLLLGLRIAALAQLSIAFLNLFLVQLMKWEPDLDRMPPLIHEVFQVHCYFISITLAIFAAITWRFAPEIAAGNTAICIWLAAGIGAFWLIRSAMQWTHYSSKHWRGHPGRTFIHFVLFFGYGALAAVYLTSAFLK